MIPIFYTTPEIETFLNQIYNKQIQIKQAEINAEQKRTRKIQKYTAKAFIDLPYRVFVVNEKGVFFQTQSGEQIEMPAVAQDKGGIYKLDFRFQMEIEEFIQRNPFYTITFAPSGRYGPTIDYCRGKNIYPAVLKSLTTAEELNVEDEFAYSIGVL